MVANAFTSTTAKNARETHGMDAGFASSSEAFLPHGADLDFVKAHAAGPDLVLMGCARRPEHKREGSTLALAAAVAFTVQAVGHQGEKASS